MLLSKHDEKKSDSDQSEGEFNALGEKVELKMIAEEENEGKTYRTMQSNPTEDDIVMLIEEKNISIHTPERHIL